MKKLAMACSAACLLMIVACGSENDQRQDTTGDEQLEEPYMNSGANMEGRRATEAVSDSVGRDSGVIRNDDAMSTPH